MYPRWTTYGEKRPECNGKYWEVGSSIPVGNFPDFSRWIPTTSSAFRQDLSGNHRKKSWKFPIGILLPCSRYFPCFPEGSSGLPHLSWKIRCQERSIWDFVLVRTSNARLWTRSALSRRTVVSRLWAHYVGMMCLHV